MSSENGLSGHEVMEMCFRPKWREPVIRR